MLGRIFDSLCFGVCIVTILVIWLVFNKCMFVFFVNVMLVGKIGILYIHGTIPILLPRSKDYMLILCVFLFFLFMSVIC